tara:strand:+ start:34779 stop:36008 length:1230 start_codon:yes stop_codon:yes gene_type:complete
MSDLLGLFSITLVSLFTVYLALRLPGISKIIYVALGIRLILLFIGQYIDLPDSTSDAENFEFYAWQFAQGGFSNLFDYFRGPDPFFISWLIAIPYSLLDRSELMAKAISLFFGIGSVFLGWLIANQIWNKNIANKVGWIIALFPSLILYSILIMREVYVVFFLLLALYGVVDWTKNGNFKSIIIAMIGFFGATFFHGAMLVGGIAFLGIVFLSSGTRFIRSLIKFRLNFKVLILFFFVIISGFYLSKNVHIPYLESFDYATNINTLFQKTQINTKGGASYPEWLIISSPVEMFYKLPLRSIYLIFAPFPWDVTEIKHVIGMIDSILYIYLTILIFQNRANIWKNPALRIFLIILLSYILVFGIGVGNFGTGIRHRSKFAVIFILLAAPLLKKIIFLKKKNFNNFEKINH